MRSSVGVAAACLSVVLAGCSLSASDQNTCPDTVFDPEGGITDGIDLILPGWLPTGFPIPAGTSIRHINEGTPSRTRVLTGFIPGGDGGSAVARMRDDLNTAGFEILLAADGFVPVANAALAALDPDAGVVVWFDTAAEQLPVRVGDECPWRDGLLVGMQFEQTSATEAARRFDGSSLTFGSAQASVGGREFTAHGECLVLDDAYTFTATTGDNITLQFDTAIQPASGWAGVTVESEVVFNLDLDLSGVAPEFGVLASGFSMSGMFVDGVGDRGIVEGHVEVTCPW